MNTSPNPVPAVIPVIAVAPVQPTRIVGMDVLRLLAAVAVVFIHTPETPVLERWTLWGRFAVPGFTAMSIVLLLVNLSQKPKSGLFPYVRRRFIRLYTLFLLWNVVYLAARLLKKAVLTDEGDKLRLTPGTFFLSGFAEHLYYLSFLAWLSLLMAGLIWIYVRLSTRQALGFSIVVAILGLLLCLDKPSLGIDLDAWPSSYFVALSVCNLAAGCFALLIGWLWMHTLAARPHWRWCLACTAAGLLALWLATWSSYGILWGNLSGSLFVLAALTLPIRHAPAALNIAAACTLPVYCVHVLFIEGFQSFAHKLQLGESLLLDATTFLVAVTGSFLFGVVLQRLPRKNWFVVLHR